MPKKVVIKIKSRVGSQDFTAPIDFGVDDCYCCAVPVDSPQIKVRAAGAKSMREVLDGLEQMYEDLYGGE